MARGKGMETYGGSEYGNPFEQNELEKPVVNQPDPEDKKEKDPQPAVENQEVKKVSSSLAKYKKKPKYQTYVAHNVRIPKEMRHDLEKIAKKLGIKLGKNTGFFQEFTIDALRVHIEKAKKELDIDD